MNILNKEIKMDLLKMKKLIEEVRDWALKNGNTMNGLDYRMLYKAITGKQPTKSNWENRKGNDDYAKAAYAYGVYAFKGLNNWNEYKQRANADKEFLEILN
jgi:hypothetical protein